MLDFATVLDPSPRIMPPPIKDLTVRRLNAAARDFDTQQAMIADFQLLLNTLGFSSEKTKGDACDIIGIFYDNTDLQTLLQALQGFMSFLHHAEQNNRWIVVKEEVLSQVIIPKLEVPQTPQGEDRLFVYKWFLENVLDYRP